jgi:protein involved in polysaccharide export with SLBB domain
VVSSRSSEAASPSSPAAESSSGGPSSEAVSATKAEEALEVVLQPYDVIRMRFLYWPELDDEQTIRPDGKISLLMVGDVEAQGLTPDQLQKKLLGLYESKLNNPEINVVVSALASNRVYVGGEVLTPGLILVQSKMTALEAVMQAGGFKEDTAKKGSVVVVRQQDGKQVAQTVDLRKALKHPETATFYLQPYDVVYVPRTTIARVDRFVEQYLNEVIPNRVGAVGFSFSKSLNTSKGASSSYPINLSTPTVSKTP